MKGTRYEEEINSCWGEGQEFGKGWGYKTGHWRVRHGRLTREQAYLLHHLWMSAAAAGKSLQSCPTLCDPIDGSTHYMPGTILGARDTLKTSRPGTCTHVITQVGDCKLH